MEQNIRNALLGEKKIKRLDKKCSIHIHSLRHRLADPGGISNKAAIDGIVNAGLLRNDSSKEIKEITESQEKIPKDKQEKVIITIKTN